MEKKKIIVFGSAGNLGMYFIDYLNENLNHEEYEIIAVGTRLEYPYEFYKGKYIKLDITNKEDFKKLPKENIHAAVNFAGVLPAYLEKDDPYKYIDVNITGTLNILEYCKETKTDRIIYTQTWADLNGYLKDKKPLKPELPRKPIYKGDHAIYTATKCTAVDLIECYHQIHGIKNFIFRLPNIYLYSPNMHYYVDGEKKYISYRYIIQRAIEGIIKVFSPKDAPSKIIPCPKKKDCDDFVMDITNIKEELGYEPKYNYMAYLEDYKKEMQLNRFVRK